MSLSMQAMHLRWQIAEIVNKISPLDAVEKADQAFVLGWLASGSGIFRIEKPATPDTHLVSYFVPVDWSEKKILLVHHKKANLWLPPGGHVDINEHPKDTVSREMKEELFEQANFYSDDPLFLTVTKTVNELHPHTDVSFWYVLKADSKDDYSFDDQEFHSVSWFRIDQLPESAIEPHLSRFLQKLKVAIANYSSASPQTL